MFFVCAYTYHTFCQQIANQFGFCSKYYISLGMVILDDVYEVTYLCCKSQYTYAWKIKVTLDLRWETLFEAWIKEREEKANLSYENHLAFP